MRPVLGYILGAILAQDPDSRVACETRISRSFVVIAGEFATRAQIDYQEVVRACIEDIRHADVEMGFDRNSCALRTSIQRQSERRRPTLGRGGPIGRAARSSGKRPVP